MKDKAVSCLQAHNSESRWGALCRQLHAPSNSKPRKLKFVCKYVVPLYITYMGSLKTGFLPPSPPPPSPSGEMSFMDGP